MDSVHTPELDASFDDADVMPSWVFAGYLCSVGTIYDNSRLQLAPSIESHKLWCQAMALLLPVPEACTMLASKLIHYLPVIQ